VHPDGGNTADFLTSVTAVSVPVVKWPGHPLTRRFRRTNERSRKTTRDPSQPQLPNSPRRTPNQTSPNGCEMS
jgi:hypothetical protein